MELVIHCETDGRDLPQSFIAQCAEKGVLPRKFSLENVPEDGTVALLVGDHPLTKDFLEHCELHGLPIIIGEYNLCRACTPINLGTVVVTVPEIGNEPEVDSVVRAVRNIQNALQARNLEPGTYSMQDIVQLNA